MVKDKQKLIVLMGGIFVILVIVLILLFMNRSDTKWEQLFSDSAYPCEYKQEDGTLILKLNGAATPELSWEMETEEEGYVKAEADGKEKDGKLSFSFQPERSGETKVRFFRKNEFSGFSYKAVELTIPLYISKTSDGLSVICRKGKCSIVDKGGMVAGKDTKYPFLIMNEEDGSGRFLFLNGLSDWDVKVKNTKIADITDMGVEEHGFFYIQFEGLVKKKAQETEVEASSKESKAEEKIRITVDKNGKLAFLDA